MDAGQNKKLKILFLFLIFFLIFSFPLFRKNVFSKLEFKLKKWFFSLRGNFSILAFEIPYYFYPRYPERLIYLIDELNYATQGLIDLSEKLKSEISKCSCQNTQGQCSGLLPGLELNLIPGFECSPVGLAFGDPCKNREEIEIRQTENFEKIQEINFLKELLQKELESGVEEELETLSEEEKEQIKNNLEIILKKSDEVITLAQKNLDLPNECSANNCKSVCLPGEITEFKACFGKKTAQKPIKFTLNFGVQLDDLNLGEIGIRNVNLHLPEEITISGLGKLSPFQISGKEIVLNLNDLPQEIKLQVPKTPLPTKTPSFSFSCPGASSLSVCTYAIEPWKEPWCYCKEGWRPLGANRTGDPKDGRGGDCADFSFESPQTKVYGYTGNKTHGEWVYIAKDSCSESGTKEDGLANGPTDIIDNCRWQTSGTYTSPGERSEWECDLTNVTGKIHGGVYRTTPRKSDDPNPSTWWHLCVKCDPKDQGYPKYGTPYNQCENKVK